MNRLTFCNRDRIFNEYTAQKGRNRCIYCDLEYHPDYTKQQNTFVWAGCDYHLAHRRCILNRFTKNIQIQQLSCDLCKQVNRFEQRAVHVLNSRFQQKILREVQEDFGDYEQIYRQIEKNGIYRLK